MPGTPRRRPRTPGGSLLADKENDPAGATSFPVSPGAMSKEKVLHLTVSSSPNCTHFLVRPSIKLIVVFVWQRSARVSRRFSVLKVLGRTDVVISPQAEEEPRAEQGEGASSKRRRTSRVSFGSIQTLSFQKDADRNDTPSPGGSLNGSNVPRTNLSAIPDNTIDSPAASPEAEESCVPMDITRGSCIPTDLTRGSVALDFSRRSSGPRDSLPGLPQVSLAVTEGPFALDGPNRERLLENAVCY